MRERLAKAAPWLIALQTVFLLLIWADHRQRLRHLETALVEIESQVSKYRIRQAKQESRINSIKDQAFFAQEAAFDSRLATESLRELWRQNGQDPIPRRPVPPP